MAFGKIICLFLFSLVLLPVGWSQQVNPFDLLYKKEGVAPAKSVGEKKVVDKKEIKTSPAALVDTPVVDMPVLVEEKKGEKHRKL